MPELRCDRLTNEWIIFSPERATRPHLVQHHDSVAPDHADPFLEGNEQQTPDEVLAFRDAGSEADSPGWLVRVLPNRYPALTGDGSLHDEAAMPAPFERQPGYGVHEVIIECPQRESNLARLPVEQTCAVLRAWQQRWITHSRNPRLAYASIFKNKGALAGASVDHSHSQLIATPFIPPRVQRELDCVAQHHAATGGSLLDEMRHTELDDARRIVRAVDDFVLLCPYASRFPYEMVIIPRGNARRFDQLTESQTDGAGRLLHLAMSRVTWLLDDPAYNVVLHTPPLQQPDAEGYRWRLSIFPRLTQLAGFEWGTGAMINTVLPEVAADQLKSVDPTH